MDIEKDAKLLKAKATTDVKKLAGAIAHELYDKEKVTIRAIGLQSVNQTVKAIAIANSFVAQKNFGISTFIGFSTVKTADKDTTALVFECSRK